MKIPALLPACTAALSGGLLAPAGAAAANGEKTPLNLGGDVGQSAVEAGASGGGLVRTIVGLAIVIAVIYGLTWVLRQVKSGRQGGATGAGLHTLATLPLGTGRSLHLVRAGAEIVLLGVAEHGVTPIRSYTEAEARALGLLDEGAFALAGDVESPDAGRGKRLLDAVRRRTVIR
jgi:flagellar protein FliO/FliZ